MTLVLDAGALVAVDRADRSVVALIKAERDAGRVPLTHGGVVGQAWHGDARQALLARLLDGTDVVPLDDDLARQAGRLLAVAGETDVIDAAVVLLAVDGDRILSSDTADLARLAAVTGAHVELIPV